ncbi:RNA methyltransferase [Acuticoccus sp.]|uniref:RNA methyltransferase n=1 Tax=Acuticoccus sp. TaxID=1904378 RepID=UPI003B526A02
MSAPDLPSPSPSPSAPAVVLVAPQLGENIGTAARAMANFGLTDLRLVAPRDGWPSERARAAASGADHVVDAARVYDDLDAAIADLTFVIATTRRPRDMTKRVEGPADGLAELVGASAAGRTGILFGRERWGLQNDEVARANIIVTFPVDARFASLNIAQSVLLMAYEWRRVALGAAPPPPPRQPPATREDVTGLCSHLVSLLRATGYFRPPHMAERMERNLVTIMSDARWDRQQVRTLRGVLAHLDPRGRARADPPSPDEEAVGRTADT